MQIFDDNFFALWYADIFSQSLHYLFILLLCYADALEFDAIPFFHFLLLLPILLTFHSRNTCPDKSPGAFPVCFLLVVL
jgi:hypothetical protein